MDEKEFLKRYEEETPIFIAWGEFVKNKAVNKLAETVDVHAFLKIPPVKRIKAADSLLSKAFHREKEYESPYEDITDKVGVRFVVLLTKDIKIIEEAIMAYDGLLWRASKDKDYEKQREETPEHFTYESIHYVVYSIREMVCNGITIPEKVPCEIQIRTLLQHAYAEMSHDTIYKSRIKVDPMVKRYMARSMALVESADCFFMDSIREINKKSMVHDMWAKLSMKYYIVSDGISVDENANMFFIDQLIPLLEDVDENTVERFLRENSGDYNTIIGRKVGLSWVYRQPAVLLVYYLIRHKNNYLQRNWPLTEDILGMLLADMGVAPIV